MAVKIYEMTSLDLTTGKTKKYLEYVVIEESEANNND
jgi:hypothetical protein